MHEMHRSRLKQHFLNEGLDSFEPHNVLELLLFYSMPRQDTNELAHNLLDSFGSLSGVFDANYNDLLSIKGVGEHTATLLKLIPQLSRRYLCDKSNDSGIYDTAKKLGEFFVSKFIGETVETVYMMSLTSSFQMIDCKLLFRGSINSSQITTRNIIEQALLTKASMVVLAHNHPGGVAIPSSEDINTTHIIYEALSIIDVKLIEHFIIAGRKYMPIMAGKGGELNQYIRCVVPDGFYDE